MDSRRYDRSSRMDRYIQEHCSVQQRDFNYKCSMCSNVLETILNIIYLIFSQLLTFTQQFKNFTQEICSQYFAKRQEQEDREIIRPRGMQFVNNYEQPIASKPEQLLREHILQSKSQQNFGKSSCFGPKMQSQNTITNFSFQDDQSTRDNDLSLENSYSLSNIFQNSNQDHEMRVEESSQSQPIFNHSLRQQTMCMEQPMSVSQTQKPILKPIYRPIKVVKQQFKQKESKAGQMAQIQSTRQNSFIQDPQASLQRDQMKLMKQFIMPKVIQNYLDLGIGCIWHVILLAFTFIICTGLMFDIRAKHFTELQLHNLKMSECRHHFEINKCEDPVPQIREFCQEQEKCLLHDANFVVKNINILTGLIVESLNIFSSQITNRALLVLALIFCVTLSILKVYFQSQSLKVSVEQPRHQHDPFYFQQNKEMLN